MTYFKYIKISYFFYVLYYYLLYPFILFDQSEIIPHGQNLFIEFEIQNTKNMIDNDNEFELEESKGLVEYIKDEEVVWTSFYLKEVKEFIKNNIGEVYIVKGAAGSGKTTWVGHNLKYEPDVVYSAPTRKCSFLIKFFFINFKINIM